jgi:hypothetical protein
MRTRVRRFIFVFLHSLQRLLKHTSTLATAYYSMSRILNNFKQPDIAAKYAGLALQSASKSLTPNHPDALIFKKNFVELQIKRSWFVFRRQYSKFFNR